VGATDPYGNSSTQSISVTIDIPSLSIYSIDQVSPKLRSIVSRLSKDIDQGFV